MLYRFSTIAFFSLIIFSVDTALSQNEGIDQLRIQILQAESDSQRVDLKLQLVEMIEVSTDPKETLEEIRKVLRLSTMSGYEKGYLNGLLKMGSHYLARELPDSAMVPIREGLTHAREPEYRLQFLDQMGTASRLERNPIQSLQFYEQAFFLADSLQMDDQKAGISYNMSVSQKMLGDYSPALENLYRSLVYSEQAQDSTLRAYILTDIGEMYYMLDNALEGIYYLEESERVSRDLGLEINLLKTLINLGISHAYLGNFSEADGYFEQARSLAIETDDRPRLVRVDHNLGELNLTRDDINAARLYFTEALEISEQIDFGEGLYHGYIGMGNLSRKERRYDDALDWYRSALEQSREMDSGPLTGQALEEIYSTYKQMGRMAAALEALELLMVHTDSLRTMERERSRAEFEARLDSRRQEEENRILLARQSEQEAQIQLQQGLGIGTLIILSIVLGVTLFLYRNVRIREKLNKNLQERNRLITEKNEELDRLNNIKNKMFAVVAHDLRGPLSSLQSLLYLLRVHDLSKDELNEITTNLEQSLHDNATTMENLLAWARSQMSGLSLTYREFKLSAAVEAVYSQIKFQSEQKGITIQLEVDKDLEIKADYDVVKLVLRNLVSNSVKFCDSGDSITVKAIRNNGFIEFSILDTGVGIKKEDQTKIFAEDHYSQKGTKNEKGSGLGLTLCKEFVEKHGGKIWFESGPGVGTAFIFTLPLHPVPVYHQGHSEHKKRAEPASQ